MEKLTSLTVHETLDGLKNKSFSAVELTNEYLRAMEEKRALNAYVLETPEKALAQAEEADRRYRDGTARALEGIPLGIKDLFCTEGVRTTACSHILDGFVPPYESTVTGRLFAAGAGCLGKLNMDEFAMGGSNETSFYGPAYNPWQAEKKLVPGGSSGGSAAAVAANILDAESMSVWKDVDGILNADPKVFPDAVQIAELNYLDTIELAYSGAQIIHPKTIKPLQNKNIPLYVRPFGDKRKPGTVIRRMSAPIEVPILILKKDQVLLTIRSRDFSFVLEEKFAAIFSLLERHRIKVNLVHNSAVNLSLCVDNSWHIDEAIQALRNEEFDVMKVENMELLTIRGYNGDLMERYASGPEVFLLQRTQSTARIVRKNR